MLPENDLDEWLYRRLRTVEDELYSGSDDDPKSMRSMLEHLVGIQRIAARAIAQNSLTTRTIALIRSVACAGSALARFAMGIQRAGADIEKKRQAQMEEAFGKLSLEDGSRDNDTTPASRSITMIESDTPPTHATPQNTDDPRTDTSVLPPHVLRCYEWLLQNLHNPYPHHTFRTQVSKETGVSQRAISDWFTNTRRKIGWTEIWKEQFRKDRSLTVECARAVLLGQKSKSPISEELREAFLRMKDTAEKLFQDVLMPSDTAKRLDELVAGHTSKLAQEKSQGSPEDAPRSCQGASRQRKSARQPTSSKALGKRRAESVDCGDTSMDSTTNSDRRPVKRLRTRSRLPKPSPLDASQQPVSGAERSSSPVPQPTSSNRPPRPQKRRMSDEEELPSSKRLRSSNGNASSREPIDNGTVNVAESPFLPDDVPEGSNDSVTASSLSPSTHVSDQQPSRSPQEADGVFRSDLGSTWLSQIFDFKGFIDLPDIPTFSRDGGDILPPSMEPLPSTTDLSFSYPGLDGQWSYDLPSLTDSDSCSLSSSESDFPSELNLDDAALDFANIQELESGPASSSVFFDELLRIDKKYRSEQQSGTSWNSDSFTFISQT